MQVSPRASWAWIELSSELVVTGLSSDAEQLYGFSRSSVLGRPLVHVLCGDDGALDWPAYLAAVRAGQPFERTMLHKSASGLRVWVRAELLAVAEGARLSARRASGREVLETMPGGVVQAIADKLAVGGVGLWMDDRVSDEFDWSALARSLHDIPLDAELSPALLFGKIHPDDRVQLASDIQRGLAEKLPYDGVLRVRQGDGQYRQLHVFGGSTYDAAGMPLLTIGGVREVSGELALRRRVSELEEQLRAAQRGDVVGRLAGGIAHDFNNILTAILGCCEILTDKRSAPEQQRDIAQIRAATLRAADLTRQLLAFGRRQALQRRPVAPAVVLKDVTSLLRRTLPENIEMRVDRAESDHRVLVDVTQLHQVLTNLIVNAAQAMSDGGRIEISAFHSAPADAADRAENPSGYVCFSVEDTGPGIPEELCARIFEPFFSTKAPGQGSGLGLSVVQGIVEQHRGRIQVRPGASGGARFEVYLPVTELPLEVPNERAEVDARGAEAGLRVMVVEDERMVRELTTRILTGAGFRVTAAADAEEAMAGISDDAIDVLLTDVVLPAMGGPEMVRRLRARGMSLRVVYMSGYPADFVESRLQLGQRDILVHKPFTAAALLQALRQSAS